MASTTMQTRELELGRSWLEGARGSRGRERAAQVAWIVDRLRWEDFLRRTRAAGVAGTRSAAETCTAGVARAA